jgi:predicted 2-oxoglutarate/Fe(II)-dependent dioxygenase YbiX
MYSVTNSSELGMIFYSKRFLGRGECYLASDCSNESVQSTVGYRPESATNNPSVRKSFNWTLSSKLTKYIAKRVELEVMSKLNLTTTRTIEEMHGITYKTGCFFYEHRDNDGSNGRTFTGVILISEENEFVGGQLYINDGDSNEKVDLAMGDLVVFNSSLLHHVTPVSVGIRKVVVFWIY